MWSKSYGTHGNMEGDRQPCQKIMKEHVNFNQNPDKKPRSAEFGLLAGRRTGCWLY